jgi:hypothetical protein
MRALAAECGMANEFRFKDYPNEMKFKPVPEEAIGSLAAQYGLEFSADYRAFLKSHNGFYFDRMTSAAPLAPGIETFDFIRYLFGIDTGHPYNDLRQYLALPGVWDQALCAFACPVSDSRAGDPIVEIHKGIAKGRIFFVDHEVMPDVADLKAEGVDLAVMSADEALEHLVEQGCFFQVARSFSDYLRKLVVYDDDGSINVSIRRPL